MTQPTGSEMTVVLEEMRSHFKVFGEALGAVQDRLGSVETRMGSLETKVDQGFARVDADITRLQVAVLQNTADIKDVRMTLVRVEQKLDRKVDRDEVEAMLARR